MIWPVLVSSTSMIFTKKQNREVIMGYVELKSAISHERKRKRLGDDHCAGCGNEDIRVLQSTQVVLCAECRKKIQGQSIFEAHHLVGQQNSSQVIPLPANEHAILSDMYASFGETDNAALSLLHWMDVFLSRMLEIVQDKTALITEEEGNHK